MLSAMLIAPVLAKAETRFNMMAGDNQGLQLKNETQGTTVWADSVSANAGDYIRFNTYYHCGTTNASIPQEKSQNTIIRLVFPIAEQTAITASSQISSTNVSGATDNAVINVTSSQRLVLDNTATWYRDNNQNVTNIVVTQGNGYVEVNLGEISCDQINCFTSSGYVVFRGRLTSSSAPTLYASLEAIPNNGVAPLNGVDLRATATGTATGTINYKFDCTSDGSWDYTFNNITDNPKTVIDACNYANVGSYIARVMIERGSVAAAFATTYVTVTNPGSIGQDLSVTKMARNLSDNTAFGQTVLANPTEVVEFRIAVTATGTQPVNDLVLRDVLPTNLRPYGDLKIDGVPIVGAGDIQTGLNLGTLNPQQTKIVTFGTIIASANEFGFGQTDITNSVLVYNTTVAKNSSATVQVVKSEVLGATDVPTGLFDNAKLAFIFSIGLTLLLTYFLLLRFYLGNRAYVWGVSDAIVSLKSRVKSVLPKPDAAKSEEKLLKVIEQIRNKEK